MTFAVHVGDCREVLAQMPEASVDTVICDPPYGLAFMGKGWDQQVPGVDYWRAALRVAKPGAMLLAFGGTRTWHHLATAIEQAGWEIRDSLMWLYGSGFPKSLDIAKAIDKARDDRVDVLRVTAFVREARDAAGSTNGAIDEAFGHHGMAGHWTSAATQPAVPTWEQWGKLRELLAMGDAMDAEVWRLNGRKGDPGEAFAQREVIGEKFAKDLSTQRPVAANADGVVLSESRRIDVTAPATTAAKLWHGWGTALKPAWEPIILAMRPLDGTFAENAQRHGVAGLAIDGARIDSPDANADAVQRQAVDASFGAKAGHVQPTYNPGGRWPANVLLDEDAAALLDEQSGDLTSGMMRAGQAREGIGYHGGLGDTVRNDTHGDTGGASRFFYVAKAARSERGVGNDHPTVKPIDLMRYLCRLTRTPTGGVVLDPFCGSGSTGVGAMLDGRDFIGIELDPHNAGIARRRIAEADPIGKQGDLLDVLAEGM